MSRHIDDVLTLVDEALNTRPPMPEQWELDQRLPFVSRDELEDDDPGRVTQLELEKAFIEKTGPREYARPHPIEADRTPEPLRSWLLMPEPDSGMFGGPARVEVGPDPDDVAQVENYDPTPPERIRPPRSVPAPRPRRAPQTREVIIRGYNDEQVRYVDPLQRRTRGRVPAWNTSNLPRPVTERVVDRGWRAFDRDRRILQWMRGVQFAVTAHDVASEMNITVGQARHSLWRLEHDNQVVKIRRGRWTSATLPD